jgi:chemotaxis protein MotB
VAYADFVTAMMAFFLVMWLVGSTTNKEKAAVSEYFKNPSAFKGHSMSPAAGPNGPGGASTSMIKLGGAMETPHERTKDNGDLPSAGKNKQKDKEAEQAAERALEKRALESLMDEMKAAIEKSQALAPFKDQLLLDITPLGLRIQIVDKQNRPMFDIGSAAPKPYTIEILHELAKYLNEVPNKVSISGHTDVTPYASKAGYSNWDLSTDRANAARRTLFEGGMQESRVALVVGLASAALFDKQNPTNPINRRISIVVMNKDAERAELGEDSTPLPGTSPAPSADAAGTAAASANTAAPAAALATPPATAAASSPAEAPASPAPAAAPPGEVPAETGAQQAPIHRIVPIPSLAASAAAHAAAAAAGNAPASPPASTTNRPATPPPSH